MNYPLFGFDIPVDIIVAILMVNTILLILAVIGFTNLRRQIRDLNEVLAKIETRQKELQELL